MGCLCHQGVNIVRSGSTHHQECLTGSPCSYTSISHDWDSGLSASASRSQVQCIYMFAMALHLARRATKAHTVPLLSVCHRMMQSSEDALSHNALTNQTLGRVCGRSFGEPRRMATACTSVPGIVVRSPNRCGLPYFMLDGAHRTCRLKHELSDPTLTVDTTARRASRATLPVFILTRSEARALVDMQCSREFSIDEQRLVRDWMANISASTASQCARRRTWHDQFGKLAQSLLTP